MSQSSGEVSNDADYQQAVNFLLDRINYERSQHIPYSVRSFKLDRMRQLLERLGNPHLPLRIVHVAGTKGKGSTSAMIAAAMKAAGYKVGLFTSPHLFRLEERIAVGGDPCPPADLVSMVETLRREVDAMDRAPGPDSAPTYFELITALALLHFRNRRVDVAVLEVGLGGRLDSTNVCLPEVAVITSISYDHTRQLGDTLAEIAEEKAGIIKPGVPTISGVKQAAPREVIERVCATRGSRLIEVDRDFSFEYHPPRDIGQNSALARFDYLSTEADDCESWRDMELGLLGKHQAANAAVALATLLELRHQGWDLPETAIRQGFESLQWPARVEVISRWPTVVLDAAHNVASAEALMRTLSESFTATRRILVFATAQDKDAAGMLRVLLPHFDELIITSYRDNPRAMPAGELGETARRVLEESSQKESALTICNDPSVAWDHLQSVVKPNDLVCCTGSFFIAADMRRESDRCPLVDSVSRESA